MLMVAEAGPELRKSQFAVGIEIPSKEVSRCAVGLGRIATGYFAYRQIHSRLHRTRGLMHNVSKKTV
jgi:hypothetical protein